MTDTSLITVTQLPEIQENLRAFRDSWTQKAADAESMICTAETVQTLKKMRADMRKEFEEADNQRKAAKMLYMAPWSAVEDTFRECVTESFNRADVAYKAKINEFEYELKAKCKAELQDYFAELCAVHCVDFITFDTAMSLGKLKISMADATAKTPRKLQDALNNVVAHIADGMDQIATMDDSAEIMAEYKTCFDVGHAVATVHGRKRRIEAEQEAAETRRATQERQQAAVAKVEAIAAPVEVTATKEPVRLYTITFTIKSVTRDQAVKVREFLKQEGIQYE